MKEMGTAPMLAGANLREQIGGRYGICLPGHKGEWDTFSVIPFDKSIKQGGKDSPSLFNMMMRGVFKPLQEKRKEEKEGSQDEDW